MLTDATQMEQMLMERLVTCFIVFGVTGLLGMVVLVWYHRGRVAAFLWRCPQCGRAGSFLKPCVYCGRLVPGWTGGVRAALVVLGALLAGVLLAALVAVLFCSFYAGEG
jgi:hypothetical protein